jgi:hypothetical protein
MPASILHLSFVCENTPVFYKQAQNIPSNVEFCFSQKKVGSVLGTDLNAVKYCYTEMILFSILYLANSLCIIKPQITCTVSVMNLVRNINKMTMFN